MQPNNKLKVLLCSPFNANVGGISRWTGHILDYYEVCETDIELKQYYPSGKKAYTDTPFFTRMIIGIVSYLPFLFGFNKFLKKGKYNVIHLVSSASISLIRDIICLKIANARGMNTIIHFRFGRIPDLYKKRNWEQRLLHIAIKLANKAIVIDQSSFNTLKNYGYKNIYFLPNPLTPKVVDIIASNLNIKKEDRKLVFAGQVLRTKGIFELVEACKTIKNIKLKIIGFASEEIRTDLYSAAGSENDEWLDICGELSFEDTIKEMLSAGIFVLPTYTEGFPNVIIETMACACPIVTTNVGAIPEMLDIKNGSKHGLCVEPKNINGLYDAIQKMLNDREYALDCGRNAQKRVNELYSMSIIWRQLEKIWHFK